MSIESGSENQNPDEKISRRKALKEILIAGGATAALVALLPKIEDKYKTDSLKPILDLVETAQKLTEVEKQELRKKIQYLIDELGEGSIGDVIKAHKELGNFKENSLESVKGFENLGLTEKQLRDLLRFYPVHAVAQVRSLEYVNKLSIDKKGISASGEIKDGNQIYVYKDHQDTQLFYLTQTLAHELAHVADWEHAIGLSLKQRLEFLYEALRVYEVTKLINVGRNSLTREGIGKSKIENHQTRRYIFLVEWWANLCMEAQEKPNEFFKPANKKEADLVKKYLVGQGKDFDFEAALKMRKRFAAKYFQR